MQAEAQLINTPPPQYKPRYLFETLRDPVGFLSSSPQRYPEMLRFRMLRHKVYVINHPELARYVLQENHKNYHKGDAYRVLALLLGNGLINSEGEFWKRQRRLAQPAFHRDSLRRIGSIVTDSAMNMLQRWRKQNGQTINFTREMAALTIEIVAKALFTADVTPNDINTVWQSVNYLNGMAIRMIRNPLALPFWVPLPSYLKSKSDIGKLDKIVYGIIRKRRLGGTFAPDLLQLLLEARDEETGESMTEQQLRDEVMTIFMAGHETTVNALSWTWYLLKQYPDIEKKLKGESEKISGMFPAFDDLQSLKFGRQVIHESMRLYPPVYSIGRKMLSDDVIGNYFVPCDARILINIIGIHHHPQFWEQPENFRPERFENFDSKGNSRFAFIPFGGGPRICIGNNFAMMEMQLINALLSRHVHLELMSRDIKPIPTITLKPGRGVMMKLLKVADL
ncbi:MAG TPA: cytochrome P450 [Chitinophagales bacterium]|nr:cytochrome P450 [Chitinophagales bacterium]